MTLKQRNREQIREALSMKSSLEYFWENGYFATTHTELIRFYIERHAVEFAKEHEHEQEDETTTTRP